MQSVDAHPDAERVFIDFIRKERRLGSYDRLTRHFDDETGKYEQSSKRTSKSCVQRILKGLPFAEESTIPACMKGLPAAERSPIISKRLSSSEKSTFGVANGRLF